jgi:hypothetical protein
MGSTTNIISDQHSILPATCRIGKVFAPPVLFDKKFKEDAVVWLYSKNTLANVNDSEKIKSSVELSAVNNQQPAAKKTNSRELTTDG